MHLLSTIRARLAATTILFVGLSGITALGWSASPAFAASPSITVSCPTGGNCTVYGSGFTPSGEVWVQPSAGPGNYVKASAPTVSCVYGLKPVCHAFGGGAFTTTLPPVGSLACGTTAAGTVRVTDGTSGLSVTDPVTLVGACPLPTTTTLSLPSFVDTGWPGAVNPAGVSAGSTPVTSGTITITIKSPSSSVPTFSCTYNAGASSGCTLVNLPLGMDQVQASYSGNASFAPSSAMASVTVSPPVASTSGTDPSWAGYVDTSDTYASVSGSWMVPKVNCGSLLSGGDVASAAATVVGVGMADPVAIGTVSGCGLYTEQYSVGWWMSGWKSLSETVSPGDVMSANVKSTGTPGCWNLTISDETKGWGPVSTSPQCNASAVGESAEWITSNRR